MKDEEQNTSFLESFDDDEKQVAEILQQFSELVMEYEYNSGFLPLWGSKALRSVLVNIPPPSNQSSQLPLPSPPILPCTESRPVSIGLPPIPGSLPSSSNAHPANRRLQPKKKSPKITLMKKRQLLKILKDEVIEEAAAMVEPQPETDNILAGGSTSHLVYFIQSIQVCKKAIYAEARRRRKLEMQRVKNSRLPLS